MQELKGGARPLSRACAHMSSDYLSDDHSVTTGSALLGFIPE